MEKDFDFGFRQHLHQPPPDLNLSGFPFETGHLNTEPGYRNPNQDSPQRNVAPFPLSCLQQSKRNEPSNPQNWFHLMPQFQHVFAPLISAPKENIQANLFDLGQQRIPATDSAPARKRYLVFDRSGDKTTLIYSPGLQLGACCMPDPPSTYNLMSKEDSNNPLTPSMDNENIKENSRDFTEDDDEIHHEDTEELNALLNDSDYSEDDDDEETSTGHSPSTMTTHGDLAEESGDEVDSFEGPTKRQKLFGGGYDVVLSKAATSSGDKEALGSSLSGCKRLRREKMHETVSILQSLIPGVDEKDDAVVVIDEAIRYLRSLKVKAKALGLDAL